MRAVSPLTALIGVNCRNDGVRCGPRQTIEQQGATGPSDRSRSRL